jgi:hypothetical protein
MKMRVRLNKAAALAVVVTICGGTGAAQKADVLDRFLQKAEGSDLVCSIPLNSSSPLQGASALDLAIAALAPKDRTRLAPALAQLKRLERLECARLQLCSLGATSNTLEIEREWQTAADRLLASMQKLLSTAPGRPELPIESQQLATELRRVDSELSRRRSQLGLAEAGFENAQAAIYAISGSGEAAQLLAGSLRDLNVKTDAAMARPQNIRARTRD